MIKQKTLPNHLHYLLKQSQSNQVLLSQEILRKSQDLLQKPSPMYPTKTPFCYVIVDLSGRRIEFKIGFKVQSKQAGRPVALPDHLCFHMTMFSLYLHCILKQLFYWISTMLLWWFLLKCQCDRNLVHDVDIHSCVIVLLFWSPPCYEKKRKFFI